MFKKFFDRISGSKVFCIVFSILIAIALWLYIGLVENPEDEIEIKNIPLTFIGAETLESRNLMLGDGANQTVSLKVAGKRTIISRLNNTNVSATIDLSNARATGDNYYQGYNVVFPEWVNTDEVSIVGWTPRNVSYSIIQRTSREIGIEGRLIGEVEDGYQLGDITCSPNMISVSGPEELINRIDHGEVRLVREKVSQSISTTSSYVLLDADGNEIPMEDLTLSVNEVAVEVEILTVKEVPLTVDLISGGGATEKDVVVDIMPKTIEISGDAATLAGISKLSVGTVDLSKFTLSLEQDMTILFPDDVHNVTGITTAEVKLEISSDFGLKRITATDFVLTNADGMKASMVTESLDVTVRCKNDVIDNVDASHVRIVVDLTDMSGTKGLVPVKARVYVDGYTTAGAIGDYTVMVQLD